MNYPNYPKKYFDDVFDSKILVVDDQENNVKLLEFLLQRNGYRSIRWTTDPRDVEQIYHKFRPDLVPLEGRIVAVCDVFDALTSERPYKKAWPVGKAVLKLKDSSGIHFDPVLVDKFTAILPQILRVKECCQDEPSPEGSNGFEVAQSANG